MALKSHVDSIDPLRVRLSQMPMKRQVFIEALRVVEQGKTICFGSNGLNLPDVRVRMLATAENAARLLSLYSFINRVFIGI